MDLRLLRAVNTGNDILRVEGELVLDEIDKKSGRPKALSVLGNGWVSAITNHFGPECYGPDGHRLDDATPRRMTDEEKQAYLVRLLEDVVRQSHPKLFETSV